MDVQVGDVIQTKKPHPCGANRFDVLRVGMDFKIKCQGCGHEIMLPPASALSPYFAGTSSRTLV